jgi:DNA-binding FrmR family transcriptional regulator
MHRDDKPQLLTRLSKIEGQVRGIRRMVEDGRYCIDVLTQIQAAEAALRGVALGLLDDHVHHCMVDSEDDRDEKATELMEALGRFARR